MQNLPGKSLYGALLSLASTVLYALYRVALPGKSQEVNRIAARVDSPKATSSLESSHRLSQLKWRWRKLVVVALLLVFVAVAPGLAPGEEGSFYLEQGSVPLSLMLRSLVSLGVLNFLPGLAILEVLTGEVEFSRIENVVVSWLLSVLAISLLSFGVLSYGLQTNLIPVVLATFTLLLFLVSFYFRRSSRQGREQSVDDDEHNTRLGRLLLIFTIASFLVVILVQNLLNPILVQGDLWNHANQSAAVLRGQREFFYPWLLHFYIAGLSAASGLPVVNVYSAAQLLAAMCVLAFFSLAKRLSKSLSHSEVAVATFFFALFMGLGWVLFAILRDWYPPTAGLFGLDEALLNASQRTYDLNSGVFHLRFYLYPFNVSFTAFLLMLSILQGTRRWTRGRLVVVVLLAMTSFLAHVFEIVILSLLLFALSLFSPSAEFRKGVRWSSLATLAAVLLSLAIDVLAPSRRYLEGIYLLGSFAAIALLLTTLAATYLRWSLLQPLTRVLAKPARLGKNRIATLLVLALAIPITLYAAASIPEFFVWNVYEAGAVPWYLYAIRLGVLAVLGLAGGLLILLEPDELKHFLAVVVLTLLAIGAGRVVAFLPSKPAAFGEFRIMDFAWIGVCIFAAYFLARATTRIRRLGFLNMHLRRLLVFAILFLVVTTGVSSTLLYNEMKTTPQSQALAQSTTAEMDALLTVYEDYSSGLMTAPTFESRTKIRMYALTYRLEHPWSDALFQTTQPQTMFALLEYLQRSGLARLYFSSFDDDYMKKSGYTYGQLAKDLFPLEYENDDVTITSVPAATGPSDAAPVAVATPMEAPRDLARFLAMSILGLSRANYTTMLSERPSDPALEVLFVVDSDLREAALHDYVGWAENGKTLIIINTSDLSDDMFSMFGVRRGQEAAHYDTIVGATASIHSQVLPIAPLHKMGVENDSTEVVANYKLGGQSISPFAVKMTQGSGQIILVDLKPYVEAILQNRGTGQGRQLYAALAAIPSLIGFSVQSRQANTPEELFLLAEEEVRLSGQVVMASHEVVLRQPSSATQAPEVQVGGVLSIHGATQLKVNGSIASGNNYARQFDAVLDVEPAAESSQVVEATNVTLTPHSIGGYTEIAITGGYTYNFSADLADWTTIKIGDSAGIAAIEIRGGDVSFQFVQPESSLVLARTPTINLSGQATVEVVHQKLWELWASEKETFPSGASWHLRGRVSMEIAATGKNLLLLLGVTYDERERLDIAPYSEFSLRLPQFGELPGILLYLVIGALTLSTVVLARTTFRRNAVSKRR